MDHLEEGIIAPDFQLHTPAGAPLKLSEAILSGPIALAFYKSSCPTSQFTFPFIQNIFSGLTASKNPRIWGISQDDAEETIRFIDENSIEFPIAIDEHPYRVSSSYEIRFVPTLYLIDHELRIRMADFGFSKTALNTISKELADSLGCRTPSVFSDFDGLPERRPG
jgi:peroxiredoxin